MKKALLVFTTVVVVSVASSAAFGQGDIKTEDACKNIVEITDQKKLIKSRLDSDADYTKYTEEADIKIHANQKKIAKLKTNQPTKSEYTKDVYDKMILDLERKNADLKYKFDDAFERWRNPWSDCLEKC